MNPRPAIAIFVFLLLALGAAPARALSPADQEVVAQAETYFDQVHTLKAHFLQEAGNGAETEGTLYIDRPGKLRLEYQPPSPILVVTDGDSLVYYDKSLQQVSYIDLDSTMAGVLVREHVKLDGDDLKVVAVGHRPGTDIVTVTRRKDPSQGRIALMFSEKPFELRQWQVTDQQGQVTAVTLYDTQSGLALDPSLFVFHDPRPMTVGPRPH